MVKGDKERKNGAKVGEPDVDIDDLKSYNSDGQGDMAKGDEEVKNGAEVLSDTDTGGAKPHNLNMGVEDEVKGMDDITDMLEEENISHMRKVKDTDEEMGSVAGATHESKDMVKVMANESERDAQNITAHKEPVAETSKPNFRRKRRRNRRRNRRPNYGMKSKYEELDEDASDIDMDRWYEGVAELRVRWYAAYTEDDRDEVRERMMQLCDEVGVIQDVSCGEYLERDSELADEGSEVQRHEMAKGNKQICRFWKKGCKYGFGCRFRHPEPDMAKQYR